MLETKRRVLGILGVLALVAAVHAEPATDALHLSIHAGYAAADHIVDTAYAEAESVARRAIRLSEVGGSWPSVLLEMTNNLCVAQIMQGHNENARRSCDEAVSQAKNLRPRLGQGRNQIRSIRAIAFSNRGVLRVLDKDLEGAKTDFNAALSLRPQLESATRNLDVVNRSDLDQSLAKVIRSVR